MDVVVFLHKVVGDAFCEFHCLSIGHPIGLCLRFWIADDSFARDVLDGVVCWFDEDSLSWSSTFVTEDGPSMVGDSFCQIYVFLAFDG